MPTAVQIPRKPGRSFVLRKPMKPKRISSHRNQPALSGRMKKRRMVASEWAVAKAAMKIVVRMSCPCMSTKGRGTAIAPVTVSRVCTATATSPAPRAAKAMSRQKCRGPQKGPAVEPKKHFLAKHVEDEELQQNPDPPPPRAHERVGGEPPHL